MKKGIETGEKIWTIIPHFGRFDSGDGREFIVGKTLDAAIQNRFGDDHWSWEIINYNLRLKLIDKNHQFAFQFTILEGYRIKALEEEY